MALIALRGRVSARGAPAIVFKTTKGSFTLNLRPDWAPVGAPARRGLRAPPR